jgi:uncharacterized phage-associated protein
MNKEKYINAILFFTENVKNLGRTKLYKLLYFLDFDHYEKYGKPVTGESYQNKDLGPVPVHAEEVINKMKEDGLIDIVPEQVIDFVRHKFVVKAHYNPKVFSPTEIEMLCEVAEKWAHHTANEIVSASHGEAPWIATAREEIIPYPYAYYRNKFAEVEESAQEVTAG